MAKAPTKITPADTEKPDQAAPAADAPKAEKPAEKVEAKAEPKTAPADAEMSDQATPEAEAPPAEKPADKTEAKAKAEAAEEAASPLQALRAAAGHLRDIPARKVIRVLPGGKTVEDTAASADSAERIFTAASRILRNRILYEVGAPVPLTATEFKAKRRAGAVAEHMFLEGAAAD